MTRRQAKDTDIQWAVPKKLNIPPDPLELRVDFHSQAVVIYTYDKDTTTRRIVSAMDIVHALASELTFASGLLPKNTLWWANTQSGPVYALYEEPAVRKLAIQFDINERPRRYTIPVPPCLFLCQPGHAPRVFAVKHHPFRLGDPVYHAPFLNMSQDGRSCGGSNQYPTEIDKISESFWISFFTSHGDIINRSKKFPKNLIRLWEELDKTKQKKYPLDDLMPTGMTVGELMNGRER